MPNLLSSKSEAMPYRIEELLITTIAPMLEGLGHVAVGAASPPVSPKLAAQLS